MNILSEPPLSRALSESPLVLVDVGARGGLKDNWAPARPYLRVLGYEPDFDEFRRLASAAEPGRQLYTNVALHNRQGEVPLYVTRDRGLCSIFPPNRSLLDAFPHSDRFDVTGTAKVVTDTLDNQLQLQGVDDVDFLKIDTQGSELYVLEGAAHALRDSLMGVEVETEFVEMYTRQPVFADVDRFLTTLGFRLFDLRPVYWKRAVGAAVGGPRGQIVWADALYLREVASVHAMLARLKEPRARRAKVMRAVAVCTLYGYLDYALEIVAACDNLLAAEERAQLERSLREGPTGSSRLPDFPGRRGIAAGLHRLWKAVLPAHRDWSISKANIGNVD